ncbi:hypothetical protein FQN51_008662 [Onygenales sp. PD_10]|nr:hypothetical protein FQN51_008662 [Onygenales sp. PD_10]
MALDRRDAIFIFELAVYIPSVFVTTCLIFRHDFNRIFGWIYLAIFCVVRIVGACCELAKMSNQSTQLFTAAAICSSIGLSPLMLACIWLLTRVTASTQQESNKTTRRLTYYFISALTLIALVLSVIGSVTNNNTVDDLSHSTTTTKVAMIVFIAAWVLLATTLISTCRMVPRLQTGERRLLFIVALSQPFILVRLVYSLLDCFTQDPRFDLVNGDVTTHILMSTLQEVIVVVICLVGGFAIRVPDLPQWIGFGKSAQGKAEAGHASSQSIGSRSIATGTCSSIASDKGGKDSHSGGLVLEIEFAGDGNFDDKAQARE